jgi:hypothetical protein
MDEYALLHSSSHREADFSLAPTATDILHQLAPVLNYAVYIHRALRSISAFIFLRICLLASATLYASRTCAPHTWLAAKSTVVMCTKVLYSAWESKPVRALRKRAFHEFAEFILGIGNVVFLMLFWPGWLVLGGTMFALWKVWG